jgi:peroxiredoxin
MAGAWRKSELKEFLLQSMEVQMALKIGDPAPDFRLGSTTGSTQGEFQLSAYRGQNVVVCFYALDFTPV